MMMAHERGYGAMAPEQVAHQYQAQNQYQNQRYGQGQAQQYSAYNNGYGNSWAPAPAPRSPMPAARQQYQAAATGYQNDYYYEEPIRPHTPQKAQWPAGGMSDYDVNYSAPAQRRPAPSLMHNGYGPPEQRMQMQAPGYAHPDYQTQYAQRDYQSQLVAQAESLHLTPRRPSPVLPNHQRAASPVPQHTGYASPVAAVSPRRPAVRPDMGYGYAPNPHSAGPYAPYDAGAMYSSGGAGGALYSSGGAGAGGQLYSSGGAGGYGGRMTPPPMMMGRGTPTPMGLPPHGYPMAVPTGLPAGIPIPSVPISGNVPVPATFPLNAPGLMPQPRPLPAPAVTLPQCHWAFTVRKEELQFHRLQELTWLDKYYYDNNHHVQRIGLRFAQSLDPTRTVQSLKLAIEEFPVAGAKVIFNDGKTKFHYDAESVTIQLVHVEADMLDSLPHLEQLCDILCPRNPDQKQNPLFAAFLFKSSDPRRGSVLICGFQHTLGDAMSYSMFLKKWSESFEELAQNSPENDARMPPEVFTQYSLLKQNYNRAPGGPLYRHFAWSDQALKTLKDDAMKEAKEGEMLSTNDILCAQCAVMIAPFRYQSWGEGNVYNECRIYLLVDSRGRGVPAGTWGNHVVDITVDFAWHELLQGTASSVIRVARKIRNALKSQMELMATDIARFNSDRANRKEIRKIFCWNSWARVGDSLRASQFRAEPPAPALIAPSESNSSSDSSPQSSISHPDGQKKQQAPPKQTNLLECRWFNSYWYPDPETVVVEPAACANPEQGDARIIVHVCAPLATADAEKEAFQKFWAGANMRED
mmetsp:Transcript_34508/g.81325  ORF Transcript_34508/g.81325 Transcript_34508/m.81325 type:complete len:806 (+) Transcript_34508:191-2608(+)